MIGGRDNFERWTSLGGFRNKERHIFGRNLHCANKLMCQVRSMKDRKFDHPQDGFGEDGGMFVWCDAASQNRVDGGGTQRFLIGASQMNMFEGNHSFL